jgi:hypothetical protein
MLRKNLLSLQEAIVVALIHFPIRRAHFREILKIIKDRNFYNFNPQESFPPFCEELKLFYDEIGNDDSYYFHDIGSGYIDLKDCYRDFASDLFTIYHDFFNPLSKEINVVDPLWGENRKLQVTPKNLVCITTNKEGRKKTIYNYEYDEQGERVIKKYSTQQSLESLKKKIDPLSHYLVIISKDSLVNVAYFKIANHKSIITNIEDSINIEWESFQFSNSNKAKEYFATFQIVKKQYISYTSLQKNLLPYLSASNIE